MTSATEVGVTGLIATYNQRDYVTEAVIGLASQVDEVIVVDDCSTDGTWDVLNSLELANVRAIRNASRSGVSISYNRAAREARGEVLLVQGGDDRSLPTRAEQQVNELSDPEISLVFSVPFVIDATGARLPSSLASEFLVGESDPDPLTFLYFEANYICAPTVAVRRADYLAFGGFRPGIDLLQDYELWLSLAARGRFVRLESPVVEYRKHTTNLSREDASLDSPNQRRLAAEMTHVRSRFLDTSTSSTLERLAVASGLDIGSFRALENRDQVTMLQLSHPDRHLVQLGLDALFDLVGEEEHGRLLAMGLDYSDLTRSATIADVDNLAAVTRAMSAASVLLAPPDTEK